MDSQLPEQQGPKKCNIDLFKQPGITCDNQVDGPVCLNSARNFAGGPAPPFFAACAGAAYTYPDDNDANVSNLGSNLVSCCIGTSCKAPSRQSSKREYPNLEQSVQNRNATPSMLPIARTHRHHHHSPRAHIHG